MKKKVYSFGHSARTFEEFQNAIDTVNINLLVDLRQRPQSKYYPHFNRKNLENIFHEKYIFSGNFLGGSPQFHNDLLEYINNKGVNKDNSDNKLFSLISEEFCEKIFSKDPKFSNTEKRKKWLTENFLSQYIPPEKKQRAIVFLKELFKKFPNKTICFFCSEKSPKHCHRYYLLEKEWLQDFEDIQVKHLEEELDKNQASLF